MSRELEAVKARCDAVMLAANRMLDSKDADCEVNSIMWREAHERYKAACNASNQQEKMNWTTSGDFSHLPAVGIGF